VPRSSTQYASDLRRLETIAEAGGRLAQLTEERCPLCGAAAEHHDEAHRSEHSAPTDVAVACRAEASKISALLTDLAKTLADNRGEDAQLTGRRATDQAELDTVTRELRTRLEPRMQSVLTRLRDSQAQRDRLRTALQVFDRVAELEELRGAADALPRGAKPPSAASGVSSSETENFSQEVEKILRAWSFPDLRRVTYSEDDHDVMISGQRRNTHGKGVRGV
jgi:hypothetical protein